MERSIALCNGVSQWVQLMVLSRPTPQLRAEVFIKFIQVAQVGDGVDCAVLLQPQQVIVPGTVLRIRWLFCLPHEGTLKRAISGPGLF